MSGDTHLFKFLSDHGVSPVFIKKIEGYYHRLATPNIKGLSPEEYAEFRSFCERFTMHCLRIMREESTKLN